MWSVLVKGGFIMIPLCICSLVALYVIIERLIFYATYTEDGKALLRRIRPMIAKATGTKPAIWFFLTLPMPMSGFYLSD